jgi:GT2 family glycosyltransferase
MADRDPVSVLLPTVEWNAVCDQLAAQLGPDDELLIICDSERDPVAACETPDGVEVCVAGDPAGCSGKANALAHGMTRATHDRFVWTDADYERGADWLDRLVEAGETHGPASAIPFFSGDGWWRLVEPWLAGLFTVMFYFQVGELEDFAWGAASRSLARN